MGTLDLYNRYIKIVGSNLHYFENVDSIDLNTCKAADIEALSNGWLNRYRFDPKFNTQVKSLVAQLLQAIPTEATFDPSLEDQEHYRKFGE